ncbi:hypothetical protein FQR65_LT12536 [Abscondita terminalis]|nr:hypothetical protein FQR65_LT12536 [Abscondita terminalis]
MAVRILCTLVFAFGVAAFAQDTLDNAGLRIAIKVFDECSKSDGLSPCLKKKALTFLDRVGRLDKLELTDEISIVKTNNASNNENPLSEEQIEKTLPRNSDAKEEMLNSMLWNKVTSLVQGRNLEVSIPKLSDLGFDEARKGSIGSLGGKKKIGKGGKKGGGLLMGLMMGVMGKMLGLIPLGIAALFLLAGKALITAKIALLLSGIIAIKKLIAAKHGDDGGYGGGGGHHHYVGSGGGWDKRSMDESQKLAYSAFAPK